jgi:very-short-patch-repair endonuclease
MGQRTRRSPAADVWGLAESQHGVINRDQLLGAGLTSDEIQSRLARGRLHRTWRGVYAVGRPQLTLHGWWMAAVLACGSRSLLSHESAAALWGIWGTQRSSKAESRPPREIHVSVRGSGTRIREGIRVHRRTALDRSEEALWDGIPVTSPALTLIDLGARLADSELEAAIRNADKLDRIDPDSLRAEVESHAGAAGITALRKVLDRRTFALTDSELERRFLRLVARSGLPRPLTQQQVTGFRVDFYWPELGLVVETDGLRYHRTPSQQSRDRSRDQAHAAAGLTTLRFTHSQVRFEPDRVITTLRAVAERCRRTIVGFSVR